MSRSKQSVLCVFVCNCSVIVIRLDNVIVLLLLSSRLCLKLCYNTMWKYYSTGLGDGWGQRILPIRPREKELGSQILQVNLNEHRLFNQPGRTLGFLHVGHAAGYRPDGPVSYPAYIHVHIYVFNRLHNTLRIQYRVTHLCYTCLIPSSISTACILECYRETKQINFVIN